MSRRLDDSEWLALAERLPVGQQRRVQHSCGRTPTLVLRSLPEKLTAHCYRCKGWGSKNRTHRVAPSLRLQERHVQYVLPDEYTLLSAEPESTRNFVYSFLTQKGLDPNSIPQSALYSPKHGRVCFDLGEGRYIARTLYDAVPKWVQYTEQPEYGKFATVGASTSVRVLTEDYLSALKVQACTGLQTTALLGTSLSDCLLYELVQTQQTVLVFLDGDAAGRTGAINVLKTLRLVGTMCRIVHLPPNKDPKDLQIQELRSLLDTTNL